MPAVAPLLGSIALNLAIGVGTSVLASVAGSLFKTPETKPVTTQRGFTFEMAVGESVPVSALVGFGRASGHLHYLNEYGEGDDYHLQMVIKIGHGWHDGLASFLVDEKVAALSGSNADPKGRVVDQFTTDGVPHLWVKTYVGAPGQVADAELVARAEPAGRWTSAHKLTGCAYMIVTIRNAAVFGSTLPRFGSIWRGLRLYDWRVPGAIWGDQSTYVWTKNPAVIRYNFRRGIYVNGVRILGQGFSAFANDIAGYTAAANVCDEQVEYGDVTLARYEFGREIGDDEDKLSVLNEIDASYCGSSFKRGGADVPLPAQQLVSALTLTDKDRLRGYPVSTNLKGLVSAKRTMWHGQFVSADAGYALSPFVPRINTDLESVLGGRRAVTLDQRYEWSQERAQARAEIALRRQFYPATRIETFGPKALVLEPGDPITRACEWGSVLMVVERVDRVLDEGRLIGVTVSMSRWSNDIVPASGEDFVTLPTEPGTLPTGVDRTIAVSGLAVVSYQRQGGGAIHPFGRATWIQITDPKVEQVMIRVWPTAGTEANDGEDFFASARLQSALVFGPLQPLTSYTYKAIPIRTDDRLCVWTNTGTFTTGPEQAPSVAPGSIDLTHVNAVISGAVGYLVGSGPGTSTDLVQLIEARIEEVAAAAARLGQIGLAQTQSARRDLVAEVGSTRAQFAEEITTLANGQAALSQRLTQFEAEVSGDLESKASITQLDQAIATQAAAVAQQLTELEAEIDGKLDTKATITQLNQAIADEASARSTTINALTSVVNDNQAAVLSQLSTHTSQISANASLISEVAVKADNATAGGLLKFEPAAGLNGGTASLVLKVRATTGSAYGEAGFLANVYEDLTAEIIQFADRWIVTNGTQYNSAMSYIGGVLTVDQMAVRLVTSPDGTTMVINATTPSITMTV